MPPRDLDPVLARVRLVALDVDGVLTDGRIVYSAEGEVQVFDVHDGLGLAWLQRSGVHVTWISGRGCAATRRRAEELGIREVHLGANQKDVALAGVQERLGVQVAETVAMGDDLPDFLLAKRAALFCAPANARPEVRARAGLVTLAAGGRGAVRELSEHILRARGELAALQARYGP